MIRTVRIFPRLFCDVVSIALKKFMTSKTNLEWKWVELLVRYSFDTLSFSNYKRLISTNISRQIVIVGIRYINWTIGYFFNDCNFSFECSSCHHTSKFCLSSWVCSTIGWTLRWWYTYCTQYIILWILYNKNIVTFCPFPSFLTYSLNINHHRYLI